jgi:hypothetical protein
MLEVAGGILIAVAVIFILVLWQDHAHRVWKENAKHRAWLERTFLKDDRK